MRRFLLAPQAQRDLRAAAAWIGRDSASAARSLQDAVRRSLLNVSSQPHIGTVRPEWAPAPLPFLPIGHFPYWMVYDPTLEPLRVLRIFHAARDTPALLGNRLP
jgi:plasmid stabilization system protein ParE